MKVVTVDTLQEGIEKHIRGREIGAVLVDDGQFFLDLMEHVQYLTERGVDCFVSGLNFQFTGQPYENIIEVARNANRMKTLKPQCHFCDVMSNRSSRAVMTVKLPARPFSDPYIGGYDSGYRASCSNCHEKFQHQ